MWLYLNKAATQKEKRKAMSPQWRLKKKSEGERGKLFFTDECQLINSEEKDSIRKIIILQYQCNKCFKQEVSTDGKTIRWKMIGEQESHTASKYPSKDCFTTRNWNTHAWKSEHTYPGDHQGIACRQRLHGACVNQSDYSNPQLITGNQTI